MAERRLGIIMNGVTGRMGMNQHLIRSIVAIRQQGGVALADGDRVMPDPILIGRNADRVRALAQAHGIARLGTDVDAALANPADTVFFDAATTQARPGLLQRAIAAGKHVYCEKPVADQPRRGARPRPRGGARRDQARRGAGQAVPARPDEAGDAPRRGILRPHAVGARASSATGCSRATCSRRSGRRGTTAPRMAAASSSTCSATGATSSTTFSAR